MQNWRDGHYGTQVNKTRRGGSFVICFPLSLLILHKVYYETVLILERMYRCWHSALSVDKAAASECIHWHHRRMAKESAKLHTLTYALADDRYDAHRGGLLIYHADSDFVGYDTGNGSRRCITRYGYHVQSY